MSSLTRKEERNDQTCYDAILTFAAGALHIQSNKNAIIRIHFLAPDFPGAGRPGRQMVVDDAPPVLVEACQQLRAYFSGQLQQFTLPIEIQTGSLFQRQVWEQLRQIPFGATWSYEDLAFRIAKPGQVPHQLARAVGAACAANPVPVMIPCHRVIGKNGRLVGFAGGINLKAYLLNHEMLGI
ncbi:MAG: methylated-DNA--[protein]-cysteine S-methyltransferase [Eubacteriales bacterium]|nr:methylated-DNA--[protein]-cysteine S-methyltransferase [Eubacteriales bacterium]